MKMKSFYTQIYNIAYNLFHNHITQVHLHYSEIKQGNNLHLPILLFNQC
jgi:hypothetical protein